MVRKRLNPKDRKREILNAGMEVFKKKGFVHTTMEDIIENTTLSKGGVYYYYKSTTNILHDLMYLGMEYRMNIIKSTLNNLSQKDNITFLAEQIFEKIVDDNPYMDIYVQFLIAKKSSEKLENLFLELKERNREVFKSTFENVPDVFIKDSSYDLVTDFINSMIMGSEILNARDTIRKNKDLFVESIKILLKG